MRELAVPVASVCQLAKEAGEAIMAIYTQDFTVTTKSDASPLTAADLAAHYLLQKGLNQLTPHIPVLSEESACDDIIGRRSWHTLWMLDPLDGTKEFVNRNGEFTVNIALIDNGEPVLGIVYVPAQQTLYWGSKEEGAWKQIRGQQAQKIYVRPSPEPPVIVGSRSHSSQAIEQFVNNLPNTQLTAVGSSLKFCLLAEGVADLYPRLGPTSEWDTAAADAILRSAGGQVIDLTTQKPMRYNQRETLLNPNFVAFTQQGAWWEPLLSAHTLYQQHLNESPQ